MCENPVGRHPENPSFPFCGPRCKLADLGNWLDERYVVPTTPAGGWDADRTPDDLH